MKTNLLRATAVVCTVIACLAFSEPRTVEFSQAVPSPGAGASGLIDPYVDELVRAFSDRVRAVPSFRMRVADTLDVVEDGGQSLQYAHVREVLVRRPDRVWCQTRGDLVNRTIWKDGRTVTLFDQEQLVYARIDDPGTLEQMMDLLHERYGFSTPMADVLSDDPYAVLMEGVTSARHLGEHLVGEEACHHLAFEHPDLDWQLWLSTGDAPELRKLVITYKHEPGSPQFTMTVLLFERVDDVPESRFAAQLPQDADEIKIVPLDGGEGESR